MEKLLELIPKSSSKIDEKARMIALSIVMYLGPAYWMQILRGFKDTIGYTKMGEATDVKPGTISSAIKKFSLSKEKAFQIFYGLAREYPNIMKTEFLKLKNKAHKKIDEIWEIILELENQFMDELEKSRNDHAT